MISRRDFLQTGMAAAALYGGSGFGNWGRLAAQQALTQDMLLEFETFGNVSLIHVTDIHAQLKPIYFREPAVNIGVGDNKGAVPHITGAEFRKLYGIDDGSPSAYALTHDDFSALAQGYGRVGGLDRVATVINAIRAARPDALLLDGGDTWHGSYTCHHTQGQDMVNVMNALKPDAMTFHWEFTLGSERVQEIVDGLPFAALGQNIFDAEWDEPAELFPPYQFFERGGVKPSDHLSAGGAYEWAVAELSLQCCGMLIARVFSDTVAFDAAPAFTDLTSDRAQHRLGYQFAWLKKAAGIAQSAELESEAEPVLRLAATPDAQKILVAQRMMSRAGAIIRRQREERPPLSGGENAPVRHDGLLRVCEILFA